MLSTNPESDLRLHAGFQPVTHSIDFHPTTLKKAQDIVKSDNVKRVEELQSKKLQYISITAAVIRTASFALTPYKALLEVISCIGLQVFVIQSIIC